MKKALLLIDIQNDYFQKGAMELEGSMEAGCRAGAMLKRFRDDNLFVVHIQHLSIRPGATFLLPDTEGVFFHETVRPLPGETVIQKYYPNGFRETMLLDYLKKEQVGHLTIGGMMTHMCVDATVRAAFDHGLTCTVLHDACAARALTFGEHTIPAVHVHGAFLAALGAVYARISSVGEAMEKMSSG